MVDRAGRIEGVAVTLALPPHLAPWRASLKLFPQDLAMTLGAWIPRLASSIGPLGADVAPDGEPDGFAGLARRGPYERLLHSEWLLVDDAPDEFVRRAVDGEHAFVELSRRQPRAARRTIAVFDGGPDQIGAPRLAHLATLLVLDQRARAAHADLHWGLAHEPEHVHECVNPQSVLALVNGRTARLPDEEHLRPWLERAVGEDADDLWLVGHRLAGLARTATRANYSSLVAHDVLAVDRTAIEVRIARRRRAAVSFELTVPESRAAARLLRDPFEVKAAAPTPGATTGDAVATTLSFSMGGDRLLARQNDGSIIGWHVPGSAAATPGRPRILRPKTWLPPFPPEAILGVQHARRRRAVVAALWGRDLVCQRGDHRIIYRAPGELLEAAQPLLAGDADAPIWRLALVASTSTYLLWTPGKPAFCLDGGLSGQAGQRHEVDAVIDDVVAVAWIYGAPARVFVRSGDGVTGFRIGAHGSLGNPEFSRLQGERVLAAGDWIAVGGDSTPSWQSHDTRRNSWVETPIPTGGRVFGLTRAGELLCVGSSGLDVTARRGQTQRRLCSVDRSLVAATLAPDGDRAAVMSADGTARALSVATGKTLAWITPGGRE